MSEGEVIEIEGEEPYTAAADRTVRERDLRLRPRPRPADVLRVVPGLFVNQHAGGGKANQYFLRGFDADHGTDVALSVDGVPVNVVSHAHGQGYAVLSWIIPELVQRLDVTKGPYAVRNGDFATAGAVDLATRLAPEASSVSLTSGSFRTGRLLGILSPAPESRYRPLLAAEAYTSDGPFRQGENLHRYNLVGRVARVEGAQALSLTATGFGGSWDASGQLPRRAIDDGRLDRFGSVDPSDGGESSRRSVYAQFEDLPDEDSEVRALAYLVDYRLDLFSNFTFFSADQEQGDQIEQLDERTIAGAKAAYRRRHGLGRLDAALTVGADARLDDAQVSLWHTQARERLEQRVSAHVGQVESETVWVGDDGITEARGATRRVGVEMEARAELTGWLWGRFGLRALDDRPLTEDAFLVAEGFVLLDLTLGYRARAWDVALAIDNLTNAIWYEAQFANASRLPGEPATGGPSMPGACPPGTRTATGAGGDFAGCEDAHVTPGAPLNAMLTLRLYF